ncbi:thioesterase II family protein [Nonomuraea recticatena]|uniref:Alpha/beta fold hydrolase n=1 Tax=Nonomuraea recticatena TaxID=46178 RepID=A0ABN3TDZ7_9ACTN
MVRTWEQRWLRSLTAVERPGLSVVCFPHSGGSAGFFAEWAPALPPAVRLLAVQYPGRGDRFREPPVGDVRTMAAGAAAELLETAWETPCVLFGHSLGALVAYETALALREAGVEPLRLCVSSSPPPELAAGGRTHLGADEEFWTTLCELGGIDADIAGNTELRSVLLPMLRSDVRASETYRPRPGTAPLSCAVRCYHGDGDPLVEEATQPEWARVTTGDFALRVRPGGHFHLRQDLAGLVADTVQVTPV